MIDQVLIQKQNGEFATINGWAAWFGFDQKAYPISFFEWQQLRDGQVELTPATLVVGGVSSVCHALRTLGAAPAVIDFPDSLRGYLGRSVWATTMAEVRICAYSIP